MAAMLKKCGTGKTLPIKSVVPQPKSTCLDERAWHSAGAPFYYIDPQRQLHLDAPLCPYCKHRRKVAATADAVTIPIRSLVRKGSSGRGGCRAVVPRGWVASVQYRLSDTCANGQCGVLARQLRDCNGRRKAYPQELADVGRVTRGVLEFPAHSAAVLGAYSSAVYCIYREHVVIEGSRVAWDGSFYDSVKHGLAKHGREWKRISSTILAENACRFDRKKIQIAGLMKKGMFSAGAPCAIKDKHFDWGYTSPTDNTVKAAFEHEWTDGLCGQRPESLLHRLHLQGIGASFLSIDE
jgi:hypothetical protein